MVANLNLNGHSASFHSSPPPLPPGKSKHHIVMLESIHCAPPTFDFPHTMDTHLRTTPAQVAERIRDATIVIACVVPVTPADMDQAPYLGILAVMAVGIGWVDKADCARRGVTVTNCIAGNVDAVSEHFLGLYFAARKNLVRAHRAVTQTHDWKEKGTLTKTLFSSDSAPKPKNQTENQISDQDQVSARGGGGASGPPMGCGQEVLGIMGYGALGKRIEKLAKAVGFGEVLISERKHGHGHKDIRQGRTPFTETLRRATTICICLPKEPDTIDLIDEKELRQMRPDACLINLARGGIVNEAALAKALREHWIACAATDVLEVEPAFPGSSPLVPEEGGEEVPNLTISPHIAWYTQSTIENYKRLLKQGIEGWVAGTLQQDPDKVDEVVVVHGAITDIVNLTSKLKPVLSFNAREELIYSFIDVGSDIAA
ncbi:hypothetical protein ABEF95_008196 [Exophiala dermatitidis]